MEKLVASLILIGAIVFLAAVLLQIPYCLYHSFTPMYEAPLICR